MISQSARHSPAGIARVRRYPRGAAITLAELQDDPHPVLARLRPAEPVSWVPVLNGWLVTRRDLALAVMRDSVTFTVDDPRFSTARVVGPSMLSLDGPSHDRHRRPFTAPFSRANVHDELAAFVTGEADRLLGVMRPAGRGDLSRGLAAVVESGDGSSLLAAAAQPGPATGLGAGTGLSTAEIVSNAAVLMFGGIETTEGMIANAAWHLLSHPAQLDLVRADPGLLPQAIEESLRLEPAAAVVDRYATRDADLGGAAVSRGDLVSVSVAGAGRDPAAFPDPDRFDVRRASTGQNLAFARGPHFCLGVHLARLEAHAALTAALGQLPGLRPDPDRPAAPRGLVFRKPPSLHVLWDAAAGTQAPARVPARGPASR